MHHRFIKWSQETQTIMCNIILILYYTINKCHFSNYYGSHFSILGQANVHHYERNYNQAPYSQCIQNNSYALWMLCFLPYLKQRVVELINDCMIVINWCVNYVFVALCEMYQRIAFPPIKYEAEWNWVDTLLRHLHHAS